MITNIDRIDELVTRAYADGYHEGARTMLNFIADAGLMNKQLKEILIDTMETDGSKWDEYMDDHYDRFIMEQIRNMILEVVGSEMRRRRRSEEGRTYGGYVEINDETKLKGI